MGNQILLENIEKCVICDGNTRHPLFFCLDYTVSKKYFEIVICDNCGFAFTSPRPAAKDLGYYYESDEYISHSNTSKGFISRLYQTVRKHTLKKKLQLINRESAKGNLLDIGCGTGEFMNTVKQDGWIPVGIEPSASARKQCEDNYSLDVREESSLNSLAPQSFDVITMWHVLEHVPNLRERVQKLKELLKNDGVIIIAVPNRNSDDAKHYQMHWAAYDVPRHLWHFRVQDMRSLVEKDGLSLVKVLPMKFDSYYVSMLSEKYKTGSSNLVSALWRGWLSNKKAGKEGASSLIYIIRHKK
jgi:SAM-dependent methyltransferase